MDRLATLQAMRAELADATAARDWDRVGAAVRALPAMLQALRARAPGAAERRALAQLRAAHDEAARACGEAAHELAARLDEMHSNKEGWMAYAISSGAAPAETTR
jgi:hypothetical protein